MLGRAPGSGELLVRKTMETFIDINNTNEFKAYMLLQGKGKKERALKYFMLVLEQLHCST